VIAWLAEMPLRRAFLAAGIYVGVGLVLSVLFTLAFGA
jgi:hypothetical protein